ncbi:MAG: hypothetical protein AABX23_03300 [Nanoarchaeota archaeon]
MIFNNKKGDLVSSQLALIIATIVGFAILAFALFQVFENRDLSERDLCRLSIISRATVPSVVQQAIPLNCHTEKICITVNEGFFDSFTIFGNQKSDCKQFAGEKNVADIKVKMSSDIGEQTQTLETIQRKVANAMFDCWYMTGQGKMDIFTQSSNYGKDIEDILANTATETLGLAIPKIKPACVICSRVAFSDKLIEADKQLKQLGILKQINYNTYMSREKVPRSSLTYFQAFTDPSAGTGYSSIGDTEGLSQYFGKTDLTPEEFANAKAVLLEQFKNQPVEKAEIEKMLEPKLVSYLANLKKATSSNQIAIVFSQIKVPSIKEDDAFWNTLQNGAILGGITALSGPGKIASFLIPGPGWYKALFTIAAVGGTSLSLASDASSAVSANQALSAATCGKFESTLSETEKKGCSLVKLMNWDVNSINGICNLIEGKL